jgi:two-component system LytT family response regulator
VDVIDWIEASGNYVRIHSGEKSYLIRGTMNSMERKLDPALFIRIHRSFIVNVDSIKELESWFHGDYKVVLKNGKELVLSRNYRRLLQQFN